jgi:hypothetical protein
MTTKTFSKLSLSFTAFITCAIWALLIWDHYHGGVPSHHFFANKDLPAISNWWGGLLLPVLTAWLLFRIQKRVFLPKNDDQEIRKQLQQVIYGCGGGLLLGLLISFFFNLGNDDVPGYLILSLFPLALLLPIYRAECLLSFVLAMTYTFGGVLPTIIGSVLITICFILYRVVREGVLWLLRKFFPQKKG